MLKIQIDRRASAQINGAADWADTLPFRILKVQMEALDRAGVKIVTRLARDYGAGSYIDADLEPFGPIGMRLKLTPKKTKTAGRDGRNPSIGAAILLGGKKGGGYIRPRRRRAMKLRDGSVADGYPEFAKKVRKVVIASKREAIKNLARQIVVQELQSQLGKQGFGPRGGGGGLRDIRMRG